MGKVVSLPGPPERHTAGVALRPAAIRITFAIAGALLVAAAALADGPFFERHVLLPYYFQPPRWLPPVARAVAAAAGAALAGLAGPALARLAARRRARLTGPTAARAVVALAAALLASEGVVRLFVPAEPRYRRPRWELTVGGPHPRYGWASYPRRATPSHAGPRPFTYVVDADGRRAPSIDAVRDGDRPALIVIGESIAAGYGLDYDETFAVLCGRALGLEPITLAEGGYAPDQAYLRLVDALPGVAHPAAVVSTFVPVELGRMLHDGFPRLVLGGAGGGELVLQPPAAGLLAAFRLRSIVHNRLPYAGDAALARALATTRAVLGATAAAARARGAVPLFVIPSRGPPRALDAHPEAAIVRALFVEPGLPYLLVDLDGDEVIPRDGHPSPSGARKIARAIDEVLRTQLPGGT
jgi:hypothetical protein